MTRRPRTSDEIEILRAPRRVDLRLGARRRVGIGRREGTAGFVPDPLGGNLNNLTLGPTQRGEVSAEHATGVQAHRLVDPFGRDRRRVAIEHGGPPPIVERPRIAHRQPEVVGLAGGVAIQGERSHSAGGPPVVALGQPRMRDDQSPIIEDEV